MDITSNLCHSPGRLSRSDFVQLKVVKETKLYGKTVKEKTN